MTKSYATVRPKKHFVYIVEDLIRLYGVCRNTISNWVAEGLRPSDTLQPYVFTGAEVKRFHDARRLSSKKKLRIGEMKCFKCKNRVFPEPASIDLRPSKNGSASVWGNCPICNCVVNKRVNETDRDKIQDCCDTNTTLASLDEGYDPVLVGIGKDEASKNVAWYCANDRIIHLWQQYAGRWDSKTIDAKLAAIRQFEAFLEGKPFENLAIKDVTSFREHLKSSVEAAGDEQRSVSTVRHCASHLKSFLEWLIDQKGYKGLNRSMPKYFELPKKFEASVIGQNARAVPTDEEAVAMVVGMPTNTLKARRDRAMVATAILAALRADTVTTLRVKHLEVSNRVVVQDARVSRTKNGKSLRINWFPIPAIFAEIVEEWRNEIVSLGFLEDDALFPAEQHLQQRSLLPQTGNIPVMASTFAVAMAFRTASIAAKGKFSPHSAKYYIGALGLRRCKTLEEQAAWSANMGHEGMEITSRYYQSLPQEQVDEVFERFHKPVDIEVPQDDLMLMMRLHSHSLTKGTPEFEQAKRLVQKHDELGTFE